VVIGYRYQSVDALWAAAASRHRAPSVELRQLAGGGRAPQLVAADIEMCIAPDGHRVVLGGGAFSTVHSLSANWMHVKSTWSLGKMRKCSHVHRPRRSSCRPRRRRFQHGASGSLMD